MRRSFKKKKEETPLRAMEWTFSKPAPKPGTMCKKASYIWLRRSMPTSTMTMWIQKEFLLEVIRTKKNKSVVKVIHGL